MADLPVYLRGHIVDPSLAEPLADVGIQMVVIGDSCFGGRPFRVLVPVAPHPEGTDAEFDPGLDGFNGIAQGLDEDIDIFPAPALLFRSGESPVIQGKGVVIGEGFLGGIGIEIVIHVDAVDVVTADDIADDGGHMRPGGRDSGVHDQFVAITEDPLGMVEDRMVSCQGFGSVLGYPVGIEPGVQFHVSFMGFLDPELQGIPERRRCFARCSRQVT